MNLERVSPKEQNYMVLKKISDYKKLYLCVDLIESNQKINNGAIIDACDFKNIQQFKGYRPFFILEEKKIIENIIKSGIDDKFQTDLRAGSVVDYAGLNYTVIGIVVNTYAQWNMPTPMLLNPNTIAGDYIGMFQGKMTNYQINEKINDNFQSGKYDSDMLIPLVDANDYEKDIIVLKKKPKDSEIGIYIAKVGKEQNIKIKTVKNIFIDTILETNGDEIQKIIEIDKDLYEKTRNFINVVNDIVNSKIEKQKNITKIEKTEDINLDFLDDLDDVFSADFLEEIDNTF
jgi:hypothetical protein